MHLTDRTDYGLRLLLFLAVHEGRAPVGSVARAFGVSETHLAKVAQALARAGFVETMPGRSGGVKLAMAPEEISIGAVVRALEPMAVVECFATDNTCVVAGVCGLQPIIGQARRAFLATLDAATLADAVKDRGGLRARLAPPPPTEG